MICETARSAARVDRFVYARHGRDCCGVKVPCTSLRVSRRSLYQMTTPIGKVLDEGNCGRVTDRGEEACECARKYRPEFAAGRILVKAARLRTETSYKAGSGRRVCTTSRSRSQTPAQAGTDAQRWSASLRSEASRSYPGRPARRLVSRRSLQQVRLA